MRFILLGSRVLDVDHHFFPPHPPGVTSPPGASISPRGKTNANGKRILTLILIFGVCVGGSIQEISRMYTFYGSKILPRNLVKIWNDTKEPPFARIFRQDLGAPALLKILSGGEGQSAGIAPHRPHDQRVRPEFLTYRSHQGLEELYGEGLAILLTGC